jgi:hypothetical protein
MILAVTLVIVFLAGFYPCQAFVGAALVAVAILFASSLPATIRAKRAEQE